MTVDYDIKELANIVSRLAEKYTSFESTSVSYEKAEQLMGAVLYCINEAGMHADNFMVSEAGLSAQQAYDIGVSRVEQKVKAALDLYNKILPDFEYYKNRCLYDTFVKGIPEFFKWYDIKFEPQNTILTLDYPVLADICKYTGIDAVYEFIKCIDIEQRFLSMFPKEYVHKSLYKYNKRCDEMIDNICEVVITVVTGHILSDKPLMDYSFEESDYMRIKKILEENGPEEVNDKVNLALKIFIQKYFDDDSEFMKCISPNIKEIILRLKNAADNGILYKLF